MYIITYQTVIIKSFYQNVIAKMVKLKILFSKLVFYAIIKKKLEKEQSYDFFRTIKCLFKTIAVYCK